jgi:hypothetical protein
MAEREIEPLELEAPTRVKRPLPATVMIGDVKESGFTPREMRQLKAASGVRLDYLLGDEADLDEKSQAMVWVTLRRMGYDPDWDDVLDVRPVNATEAPDPLNGNSSSSSSPFADSGR